MAKIIQEGVIEFEIMEVESETNRYRARLMGTEDWWEADTVRLALRGAASTAIDSEIEDALGDLWESGDG